MKPKLLFLFLLLTKTLSAQNFTEVTAALPFEGVGLGSIAFSDVNGDGSQDVLITGQNISFQVITKLYINDGMGNFTESMDTPFDAAAYGSIAFSDVNGDGSQDVLITGISSNGLIAKLYTNDGMGNFTESMGTPFDGVGESSIAFSDVNGDGSQDVLITGGSNPAIAKLYTNDGMGNFTESMGTPFDGVYFSSIAFSDVNGDGSQDVLITGRLNLFSNPVIAKLYTNDGMGNFTESVDTPFDALDQGSIAFSDVNGDGSQDVLITGISSSNNLIAKLYTNDGMGNFTESMGTPFDGVRIGSIAFSDVNGDGSQDVLITGETILSQRIAKLYTNDGMGNFTESMGTPFDGVFESSIAFSDVNGDGSQDVLITGSNSSNQRIAKLYTNDGMTSSTNNLLANISLNLILFPNPVASDNLNVSFNSEESNAVIIRVYNLNGQVVRHQEEFVGAGEQTVTVDITSLPIGSYFIKLGNGQKSGTAKFVIH